MHALIRRNAEADGTLDDAGDVGPGHDRQGQKRQGHDRQQHLHHAFDHCVDIAPHQQPHGNHHCDGAEQWLVDVQQHGKRLASALDHVGVYQMPHEQCVAKHEPGKQRMQLRVTLKDGHALVIAELEAGDDVDDQKPEQQRNRQYPHHGVTIAGACHR